MNVEQLYEGQVFKNHKEMCEVLGFEFKNSTNSKNSQLKTLSQYCNYKKDGHKIIIQEIFSTVKKRIDNRGGDYSSLKTPLTETNPRLSNQWNTKKNGSLTNDVTKRTQDFYWWTCDACNEEIYLPPVKRFNKSKSLTDENITCPCCWMSKGAKRIYKLLMKHNIDFRLEYTFVDLFGLQGSKLRFDFALVDNDENLVSLIEYDGGYHDEDESTQIHDKMKDDYCEKNDIPLLRIHHKEDRLIEMKTLSFLGLIPNKDIESLCKLHNDNDAIRLQLNELKSQLKSLQDEYEMNNRTINELLHKGGNDDGK